MSTAVYCNVIDVMPHKYNFRAFIYTNKTTEQEEASSG